ncbi:hypothetical protein M9Y10_018562 [Tritrichomonas musculus]|uniref:Uncharacterized protein n=1 Tax=Tritrichomonas musculus TaxID=1915356 RepID=A0ABR2HNS9_9EUKA
MNICLILLLLYNSSSKQIFLYNNNLYEKELTLVFFPYDIIEVHVDKKIGVFLTKLKRNIYLDIDAINSKGKVTSYGPFKESNRIAGLYFYNRRSVLKFTNYDNRFSSLSIIFAENKIPNLNISNHSQDYPIFNIKNISMDDDIAGFGRPIIYDFKRDIIGLIVITCTLGFLALFLFLNIFLSCCCKDK